jgi:flagellar motor switch protein FliN/FliY
MAPNQDTDNKGITLDEDELRRLLEQPIPEEDADGEAEVADGATPDVTAAAALDSSILGSQATAAPVPLGQDAVDQLLFEARAGSIAAPPPDPEPLAEAAHDRPAVEPEAAPTATPPRVEPTQPKAPVTVQPVQFAPLGTTSERSRQGSLGDLGILLDVPLRITVELGRAEMAVRDVLALGPGSVIELDRSAGEVLDVLVNGTLIAQGEVVVVDEQFGIRLTNVFSPSKGLLDGMGA